MEEKNMETNREQSGKTEEKEQILPDGIGLRIKDIISLLSEKHKTHIPADDPALMFVTIMNAFLEEESKLQKKHQDALAKFMSEHINSYMNHIKEILTNLSKDGLQEAAKDLVKHRSAMFICTAINFVSAILVVSVFVIKAMQG